MPSALTKPIITERGTKRINRARPVDAEGDLNDAGENNGRQDVCDPVGLDHRADHERDRAGGRRDHRGPPAEHRHHEAQHHGGDQRRLGIDAGDERERDHFGDQRQRRHQPGERFANQHSWRAKHAGNGVDFDLLEEIRLFRRGGDGHEQTLRRVRDNPEASMRRRRRTQDAAKSDMGGRRYPDDWL